MRVSPTPDGKAALTGHRRSGDWNQGELPQPRSALRRDRPQTAEHLKQVHEVPGEGPKMGCSHAVGAELGDGRLVAAGDRAPSSVPIPVIARQFVDRGASGDSSSQSTVRSESPDRRGPAGVGAAHDGPSQKASTYEIDTQRQYP